VYRNWQHISEQSWKKDEDQLKSALKLLDEANGTTIEKIPLEPEPGIVSFAFALKGPKDNYCPTTEEVGTDSTCKYLNQDLRHHGTDHVQGKRMEVATSCMLPCASQTARLFRLLSFSPK
jgi:hypothetical protein